VIELTYNERKHSSGVSKAEYQYLTVTVHIMSDIDYEVQTDIFM